MTVAARLPVMLLAASLSLPAMAQDGGALRTTLDRHLEAINARDLDALMETVTEGQELVTILPDGRVLETRDGYRKLHVDWFADGDWRMAFQLEDVGIVADAGIARVRYQALERDDAGGERNTGEALLVLVFAREAGAWRLVHDQNTVIPSPPARLPAGGPPPEET